jgi:hypothetical protein
MKLLTVTLLLLAGALLAFGQSKTAEVKLAVEETPVTRIEYDADTGAATTQTLHRVEYRGKIAGELGDYYSKREYVGAAPSKAQKEADIKADVEKHLKATGRDKDIKDVKVVVP